MNKRLLLYILLTIACITGVKAQINTDQVLQIGRNALYFEDYVLSIQYFNQVIAAKPYLAQPYFFRAMAKFNLDDLEGAKDDVTVAIERNPYITDAYELRGVILQNLGDTQGAIKDYDQALAMLPENRSLMFNKALAQENIKDYDGARQSYDNLLRKHPGFDAGYVGRSRLLLCLEDTVGALADLDKALSLNKNSVNAYLMRADIAMNSMHDYNAALADMDEAIKLQPRYAGFFINRAFIRYKLNDYYGAMSDFDYALQLDPVNSAALYNRALLRLEVHDFNNAINDLDQVITLTPKDYRALYNRAIAKRQIADYKGALADINMVIEAIPDLAAAYFVRHDIKHAMGDRSAQKDLDKSLAMAKKTIKVKDNDAARPEIEDLFHTESADSQGEAQEVVAARFTTLRTISNNSTVESEYNNKSIRGKVQDRNFSIEPEPMFLITYYLSPSELKSTGYYVNEVDEINRSHSLHYILQVTNREITLSDSEDINKHFQSIDYYNSYLSTHTPRAIDYFGRGMDYFTVHNYQAAISDFTKAIASAPDFSIAYLMRAIAQYKSAMVEGAGTGTAEKTKLSIIQAINDTDNALEHSPQMAIAYFNKGVLYLALHDYTSALAAFNKAIEVKPDFGEAYYNRGYVYFNLGNRVAGNADLSRAGELGVVPSYNLLKRMTK